MVSAALEFKCLVDEIFSTYIDTIFSYSKLSSIITKSQRENIEQLKVTDPDKANFQFLNNQEMCYSISGIKIVRGNADQYKDRIRIDGTNWQWAARMIVVTIFELWEGEYRNKIGHQKGLSKGELELSIMGEIRNLRNWIIHSKSIPDNKVNNMIEIDWCSEGEPLNLNFNHMRDIVLKLHKALESV